MKLIIIFVVIFMFVQAYAEYRAVTLINPPFVQKNGEELLEGFCIDLMKEITKITGYDYNLHVSPNGYGFNFHGKWTGMRADIAVADLTITNERKAVVDFTVPFFASGISALMLKSQNNKIKTWKHLVNQTDVTFGILENGPTRRIFQSSEDPIIRQMWRTISSNSSNFVISYTDAIRRITSGKYIFIGESSHNEYISGHRCDLTNIDSGLPHDRTYGIALHKNSPLLESFNFAINYMKISGKIAELRRKMVAIAVQVNRSTIKL